ncbi:MAG TPA: TetR family transcriptional regulator [Mycobacteriales bacterium]|nr:TetR family transcriptional regulator [Mycobacteriales bacterium]
MPVRSRRERQQETRQALLSAARDVVARRGIEGASHREIAAEAGVTIGAIYANFANKADLIVSLMDDVAGDGTMLAAHSPSVRTCLEDLGRRLVAQADSRPELTVLSMEFALASMRDPGIRARRLPHREAEHAAYARVLEEIAARSGETLPLPAGEFVEVVANLGWSLLCTRAMLGPDVITEDLVVKALGLLLQGE